jgi:DNA-directed RNA polymerase I subunit RPA43
LLVFEPVKGRKLTGVVNKVSVDHIGLLVMGIFNASISSSEVSVGQCTSKLS